MYRLLLIGAAAAAGIALAGCGSGSHGGTTTVASVSVQVSTGATTTVAAPSVTPACRRLNATTRHVTVQIGTSLSRFRGVSSASALDRHVRALQGQILAASTQVDAVRTPPGPLTRDKSAIAQALTGVASHLGAARRAADQGKVGAAARQFAALAELTALRHAAQSLARDCPRR